MLNSQSLLLSKCIEGVNGRWLEDAQQLNKTLLLSEEAEIDSRPQLQIDAEMKTKGASELRTVRSVCGGSDFQPGFEDTGDINVNARRQIKKKRGSI